MRTDMTVNETTHMVRTLVGKEEGWRREEHRTVLDSTQWVQDSGVSAQLNSSEGEGVGKICGDIIGRKKIIH